MFCFQCEQTAGCNGCTGKRGVCGKTADVAKAQDELTGALIGLAKTCGNNPKTADTDRVIIEGLFTTLTNVSFNEETIRVMIERVEEEKSRIAPGYGTNLECRRGYPVVKIPVIIRHPGCCSVCIPCDGTWISVGRSELLLI